MAYQAWVCERCHHDHRRREDIWPCVGCKNEICETCFDKFAHCPYCTRDKSDEELKAAALKEGWEF